MNQLCHNIHQLFSRLPLFAFPFDKRRIPLNGIYVLFENGELGHGVARIVRIGSHTGDNQLPSRLEQHFIQENKDRSIFRKNIGRALLSRDRDAFLTQWELDLTTRAARDQYAGTIDKRKLQEVEKRVTEYLQHNFKFVVMRVDDKAQRLRWESQIISTVAQCRDCRPSKTWLGLYSPKTKIRESGLWLVNELDNQPLSESDYESLRSAVNLAP